jgi:soluble lytic murein transglycosylase
MARSGALFILLTTGVAAAQLPANEVEPRGAPQAESAAPAAEAQLAPLPDGERVIPELTLIEVENPAFPPQPLPPAPAAVAATGRWYERDDVSGYFLEGPLAEAKAAFDRGRFAEARALAAPFAARREVRYLRALAAVRGGLHAEAASEMAELADAYPELRDRCLTHAGIASEAQGRLEQAIGFLEQVPRDSKMFPEARITLFRALRRKGDFRWAVAAFEPIAALPAPSWGRDLGAEALLALADLASQRKDASAEREALVKLWSLHPLSRQAAQAQDRLKGTKPPLAAEVARAETLIDAHRNRDGIEQLAPLLEKLALPEPLACRAHFAHGKALRKEREHRKAIATLTPVVAKCHDPDLRPKVLYWLGSSRSIVDIAHGAETYETLAREFPESTLADDALFFAADIHVKRKDLDAALGRLEELVERYPGGDYRGEALFKIFWIHRSRGELAPALDALDRIEAGYLTAPDSHEVERARYWRARVLEAASERDAAVDLYASVGAEHPATYYGLIARRRLLRLDPQRGRAVEGELTVPAAASPWPMNAGQLSDDPRFLAGVELLRLGFPEAVPSELLSARRKGASSEAIRLLIHLLDRAGDPRAAHAVARTSLKRELAGRITPASRPVWELAYPLAFRPLVEKHSAAAKVPPDLLQALMREESALDPKARSWAGALGLTQLMPATAKAVARRLKISKLSLPSLFEPELNIRIGSTYLGELLAQFKGQEEYALASYNAGSGAVNKWRRERPRHELDEWVEEIPIAETRGYVKRVLRTYVTYRLLYGAPKAVTEREPPPARGSKRSG